MTNISKRKQRSLPIQSLSCSHSSKQDIQRIMLPNIRKVYQSPIEPSNEDIFMFLLHVFFGKTKAVAIYQKESKTESSSLQVRNRLITKNTLITLFKKPSPIKIIPKITSMSKKSKNHYKYKL